MSDEPVALAIHSPFRKDPIEVKIMPNDSLASIKQHLLSLSQLQQPLTVFYFEHNQKPIDMQSSVQDAGLKSGDALHMVPGKYSFAEVVQHVQLTRDILGFKSDLPTLPVINQGAVSITAFKADSKKKSGKKPKKEDSPAVTEDHVVFTNTSSNSRLGSAVAEPNRVVPGAVARSLQLSNWNPVTPVRKLQGHLLYLKFVANDFKTFHITATVDGFYVSNSTDTKFDPSPKKGDGAAEHVSLLRLIGLVSRSTLNAVEHIANQLTKQPPLAWISAKNAFLSTPWLVGEIDEPAGDLGLTQSLLNAEQTADVKDWNEDLQMTLEMPVIDEEGNNLVRDRIIRDQLLVSTTHAFTKAASQGAMDIVEGNLVAMNPDEAAGSRIYLRNGIFYFLATDASGALADLGGDAAARVAARKDLRGVEAVMALGVDDLRPVLTTVVDYCGRRIVAQAPVPGVFRESDEEQIQYGIGEGREKVFANADYEPTLAKIADAYHLKKHAVHAASNTEELVTSMDTKVMKGTDGRAYVLDLYRLTPPDLTFLEANPGYGHKMALLRPEAIREWFTEQVQPAVAAAGEEGLSQERVAELIAKHRLNPDVFLAESEIPAADLEAYKADRAEVLAASAIVGNKLVPSYLDDIAASKAACPMDGQQLTAGLHSRGINMRYLGAVHNATGDKPLFANLRSLIEQETVVRAAKHYINAATASLTVLESHAKIVEIFNVLRSGQAPAELAESVKQRFGLTLPSDWASKLNRRSFFRELSLSLGLQWDSSALDAKTLEPAHLLSLVPKILQLHPHSTVAEEALEAGRRSIADGEVEAGLEIVSEAVSLYEQVYGAVHPVVARALSTASLAFNEQKNYDRAAEYVRSAIAINERTQGLDACDTLVMYNNLAFFERGRGNLSLALELTKHFLELWQQVGFPKHPEVATSYVNIGTMLQEAKLYPQSLSWFRDAISLLEENYGPQSVHLTTPKFQIAQSFLMTGEYKDAARAMEQAHDTYKAEYGAEHESTLEAKKWLDYLLSTAVNDQKAAKLRVAAASGRTQHGLRSTGATHGVVKQSASDVIADIAKTEKKKSKKKKGKKH